MKNIYVVRKVSKAGRSYVYLYADLGYKSLALNFDCATIVEFTGMSFEFINNLEIDKPLQVGSYSKVGK